MTATNIQDLKAQQAQNAPARRTDFPAMLERFKGEIARALPKHLNPDRMARIALTAFRQTPKLGECDPRSVFAAVIQSSQLGLEVGLMGESYLVPFNRRKKTSRGWETVVECALIPGYRGLLKLARNSGQIADIYAYAVRERDTFDVTLGLHQDMVHEPAKVNGFPAGEEERGEIVGFYAVAVFKDGTKHFEVMSRRQVDAIRDRSNGYRAAIESAKKYKKEPDTPWVSDYEAMGIKTVLRRICKYLPASPELATALTIDTLADAGKTQNITLTDAIEGTWAPADDDGEDDADQTEGQPQPDPAGDAAPPEKEVPRTRRPEPDPNMNLE